MAKLYWADRHDSESWHGPFLSVKACKRDARKNGCEARDEIFIAPIDAEKDDDDAFWMAVSDWVLWNLDGVDERLAEEGWIDPEEPWLDRLFDKSNHDVLARALRKVLPPRPEWRTVDTAKAERVEL